MLILSRRLLEAVVIVSNSAEIIVVTVVQLLPTAVELVVQKLGETISTSVVLSHGEFKDVGLGAWVTLVEAPAASQNTKARLGIKAPATARVSRKEVWDAVGAHLGRALWMPKQGAEPSPN